MYKKVKCINNSEYPVSLILNKVYLAFPDEKADMYKMYRIVDESKMEYYYPQSLFVVVSEGP